MKKPLITIINDIIELLERCRWTQQANWLRERRARIEHYSQNSPEFRATLREIGDRIAGMGSLSDLPMSPRKGSGLSREEATRRQWDLLRQLDSEISKLQRARRHQARPRKPTAKANAKLHGRPE